MYLKDFFCFEESLEKDLKIWYNWGVTYLLGLLLSLFLGVHDF